MFGWKIFFLIHTTAETQFNPFLKIHFHLVSEACCSKLSCLVRKYLNHGTEQSAELRKTKENVTVDTKLFNATANTLK